MLLELEVVVVVLAFAKEEVPRGLGDAFGGFWSACKVLEELLDLLATDVLVQPLVRLASPGVLFCCSSIPCW